MARRFPKKSILINEEYVRGKWNHSVYYISSLMAGTVGIQSLLFLPTYLVLFKNCFWIPFTISVIFVGTPLILLELFLGQFTSAGPTTCWQFSPITRGIGFGSVVLLIIHTPSYIMKTVYALVYAFQSFSMPWSTCDKDWATDRCLDFLKLMKATECKDNGWIVKNDGACYNDSKSNITLMALWNATIAAENNIRQELPENEYLKYFLTGAYKDGININNLGSIHWNLVSFLVVTLFFIGLPTYFGIQNVAALPVAVFIFTIIILISLVALVIFKDGSLDGMRYILSFNFPSYENISVWHKIIKESLVTLSVNTGRIICVSSYSEFYGDVCFYAIFVVAGNIFFSLLSCCLASGIMGATSHELQIPLEHLNIGDTNIAYVLYAHFVRSLPASSLWSVMIFLMIYMLGLAMLIISFETIVSSVIDLSPFLRKHKEKTIVLLAVLCFMVQIPMVMDGGSHVIEIAYTVSFSNMFILTFTQSMAMTWIYGTRRIAKDIHFIAGHRACWFLPWKVLKYPFILSWAVVIPVVTVFGAFTHLKSDQPTQTRRLFEQTLGLLPVLPVPVFALYAVYKTEGSGWRRVVSAMFPSNQWGPLIPVDRNLWLAVQKFAPGSISTTKASENTKHAEEGRHFRSTKPLRTPLCLEDEITSSELSDLTCDIQASAIELDSARISEMFPTDFELPVGGIKHELGTDETAMDAAAEANTAFCRSKSTGEHGTSNVFPEQEVHSQQGQENCK